MTPPLAHLSDAILHHHTHWSKLKTMGLPVQTELMASILLSIDDIIAKIIDHISRLAQP